MSNHTPGPWIIDERSDYKDPAVHPPVICEVGCFVIITMDEVKSVERDARVIAAAPDMLEALKDIAALIKESQGVAGYHLNGDVADWDSLELKLFDAIAKAEGDV